VPSSCRRGDSQLETPGGYEECTLSRTNHRSSLSGFVFVERLSSRTHVVPVVSWKLGRAGVYSIYILASRQVVSAAETGAPREVSVGSNVPQIRRYAFNGSKAGSPLNCHCFFVCLFGATLSSSFLFSRRGFEKQIIFLKS